MDTLVFDIERFALQDGPGIRTVVYLKGCPLRCQWCHNPESQVFSPELLFFPESCVDCGACVKACPKQCHRLQKGVQQFDRVSCVACGKCAEFCPTESLRLVGKRFTVAEVMEEVLRDRIFYEKSGGGLTLSGGEPLAHFDFTKELLVAAKSARVHTCVETSGYAPKEQLLGLLPLVDLWLWDIKAAPEDHKRLTGVDFQPILENLRAIDAAGAQTWLRCPLIPGLNDTASHLAQIAEIGNTLRACQRIDLEPYHPLGEDKCRQLGREDFFRGDFVSQSKLDEYDFFFKTHTRVAVHRPSSPV